MVVVTIGGPDESPIGEIRVFNGSLLLADVSEKDNLPGVEGVMLYSGRAWIGLGFVCDEVAVGIWVA